jgi:hypothetical protein
LTILCAYGAAYETSTAGWWAWPGAMGIDGGVVERGGAGGEKMGQTCWADVSVTGKEKRHSSGICKPERKAPFGECTRAYRAGWPE